MKILGINLTGLAFVLGLMLPLQSAQAVTAIEYALFIVHADIVATSVKSDANVNELNKAVSNGIISQSLADQIEPLVSVSVVQAKGVLDYLRAVEGLQDRGQRKGIALGDTLAVMPDGSTRDLFGSNADVLDISNVVDLTDGGIFDAMLNTVLEIDAILDANGSDYNIVFPNAVKLLIDKAVSL